MHNTENANLIPCVEIERDWVREQLVLKYRKKRPVSTFLDLRGIYQSKRDHEAELKRYGVVPRHDKFADIGKIDY